MDCSQCGGSVEAEFRFCPWCGTPRRLKLVEFFLGHRGIEGQGDRALRVSRYLGDAEDERHVRFSVWRSDAAEAAVSIDDAEAARLARFLAGSARLPAAPTSNLRRRLRQLHLC